MYKRIPILIHKKATRKRVYADNYFSSSPLGAPGSRGASSFAAFVCRILRCSVSRIANTSRWRANRVWIGKGSVGGGEDDTEVDAGGVALGLGAHDDNLSQKEVPALSFDLSPSFSPSFFSFSFSFSFSFAFNAACFSSHSFFTLSISSCETLLFGLGGSVDSLVAKPVSDR